MKEGKQMQESKTPPEGDAEARLAALERKMHDMQAMDVPVCEATASAYRLDPDAVPSLEGLQIRANEIACECSMPDLPASSS